MAQFTLYRICPSLREELKNIVIQELEKKGIYSKYRLDTAWGNLLFESREQKLDEGVDVYKWVRDTAKKFIYEAWGPHGRINRLFED